MKPVTEDQVISLMEGLQLREKAALRDLAANVARGRSGSGGATARLFTFTGARAGTGASSDKDGEIVSLDRVRERAHARRTSRGIFVYSTDLPEPA